MNVGELREWLSTQDGRSPVCVLGISEGGESIQEWAVNIGTGQGPSDEVDAVIISWAHSAEAEARHEERHRSQEP
ncbi:hypothetical protein [Micromonospora sp. NBC_00858]|uniref:hypothetical protein n=1 Tax=Micromonospora sp. NBC_00858 TaxID=2975979 RepID=UPI00386791D0|nr:hypothetical protein OG990_20140 [Micromonospora sp. NBC_00858]